MNYHSIWISDIHLGCKFAQSHHLLDLLNKLEVKNLFIVGDLIDFWSLENEWFWDENASKLLKKIKELSQSINVIILTGNHDDILKSSSYFNGIPIKNKYSYLGLKNQKLLIWHGDELDWFQKGFLKKISSIGGIIYEYLITINLSLKKEKFSDSNSFSSAFKISVKRAVEFISFYPGRLSGYLKKNKYDGVICGHNHNPQIKKLGHSLDYYNCGDWIENCTFIVETETGEIKLQKFNKSKEIINF